LAAEDSRVTLHRHSRNRGHVVTHNEGIDWAEAQSMLILSADDFLLPGSLARASALMDERTDVGLAHGWWDTYQTGDAVPRSVAGPADFVIEDTADVLQRLARGNFIHTATAVVRTNLQKAIGGYRQDLPHAGDLEMWVRFALNGKIAKIQAPQAVYRRHAGNMSLGYDVEADMQQCIQAFRLHYGEIRERLPGGRSLERRIRMQFAARAGERAVRDLARARFARSARMARLSLAEATGRSGS
jgi:hypothetical protein